MTVLLPRALFKKIKTLFHFSLIGSYSLHNLVSVCMFQFSEKYRSVSEELHTVKLKLDKEMDQEKRAQREREELQRENQRLEEQVHSVGQEKEEIKQDREDLR